ncbi:predicted protein [Phaeodactylum tricornutum CCAP 1055/1]|uniref:Uncharacterized protein n=1 Tax=Phaeodactylum tricornutum (strain CCAP 1055/1) TaxID=556484 RepID=B7G830_PHATC|nr:predicted protein [Phaeodactylum tricornutum CCAP 1055/1]EEC45465.1 predicted protein [Phaeodactylum tricornutum CCAP 1055/1]|eukprot:XP_002183247.1 predicted protein [Phaeodactylum tricornutum CCAP 1055/1]
MPTNLSSNQLGTDWCTYKTIGSRSPDRLYGSPRMTPAGDKATTMEKLVSPPVKKWVEGLTRALQDESYCSSHDEAVAVAELLFEHEAPDDDACDQGGLFALKESHRQGFSDYLGLSKTESAEIMAKVRRRVCGDPKPEESNENEQSISSSCLSEGEEQFCISSGDEDGMPVIGEGECELCEREIKLTKHHLIPKSTWARLEPKFRNAWVEWHENSNEEKAAVWVGPLLVKMLDAINENSSAAVKDAFQSWTCNICRPCHSMIHRTHDNYALATEYSTVESLLRDENIYNYCRWANKQRAGKYAR